MYKIYRRRSLVIQNNAKKRNFLDEKKANAAAHKAKASEWRKKSCITNYINLPPQKTPKRMEQTNSSFFFCGAYLFAFSSSYFFPWSILCASVCPTIMVKCLACHFFCRCVSVCVWAEFHRVSKPCTIDYGTLIYNHDISYIPYALHKSPSL